MTQTFGEALRERRKVRGISLVELSERTGLSQPDLVRAELGQAELTAQKMQRIEGFLRRQKII